MGLEQPVSPSYRISANDADITAKIRERFVSLRLVDESGVESDTLEIVLADHDPLNRIQRPPAGAELELWIGYDGDATRMGLFVSDEFERTGWPCEVTLRARAAVYDQTPKGKADLQTQKSRSWANGTTIGAMVQKIAKEHGMQAAVSAEMAKISLPHFDQQSESDLSFLLRILKNYDAIVKPSGGKLVVVKRGASQTVSGEDLPTVTIDATELSDFQMNVSERESPGTVVAYWHSTRQSKRTEIKVGSGDPVKRIRHYFPTQQAAKQAAQAELDKRERGQSKFSASMPGRPDLVAEGRLNVTGFGASDVDGEWLIKRVQHEISDRGYICRIDCEKPND